MFKTFNDAGGMALPFYVVLEYADGSSEGVHRTPAAWQADGRRTEVRVTGGKTLRSVNVDTGIYVDFNPGDNKWPADQPAETRGLDTPARSRYCLPFG
ncbi:MAG: hypothetical protein U1F09_10210 [Steroidobacteraceae bacterium]